jgi:hypothetical protein
VHGLVGQREDLVPLLWVFVGGVAAGKEAVVGVEGRVEQIEPVEFLKDEGVKQIGRSLRVAGMGGVKLFQ